MKLTALDIHYKEFRHSLRGYNEEEVDAFLDSVANEFERLVKENLELSEKLEIANEKVRGYQSMEATLNNTLVSAQRSAEEIVNKAGIEADSMLRDAELKAKEIIHNALQKKQTVTNELIRIKHSEEEFRARYRMLLESQLRDVSEIPLPDDVTVLLDDSDGLIGSVDVRREPMRSSYTPVPSYTPPAAPEPVAAPAPAYQPFDAAAEATLVEPEPVAEHAAPANSTPLVDPPAAGFVSSVALGEVDAPEIDPGPVELVEPGEFELPGFDAFGEREIDSDIEEID